MNRRTLLLTATAGIGSLTGCSLFGLDNQAKENGTKPGYELLPVIKADPFYQWQTDGLRFESET